MNVTFDSSGLPMSWLSGLGVFWIAAVWIVTALIHIGFSLAVLQDSYRMLRMERRMTFLVGGGMWALATLLGGVITAGIYWAIHHSTLRPETPLQ